MNVYCTHQFEKHIRKLERNSSYASILEDVCTFLSDKNIEELHQMNDVLRKSPGDYSLNKYRIPNSLINKGKRSSYRCICVCLPKKDYIVLDTIYAKTGSLGKENLEKEEYKGISKNIAIAIQQRLLLKIDIRKKKITLLDQSETL
jgi:predicted house-cleaning noncanonical NTP pyrophosphatase (MazG superfamily)